MQKKMAELLPMKREPFILYILQNSIETVRAHSPITPVPLHQRPLPEVIFVFLSTRAVQELALHSTTTGALYALVQVMKVASLFEVSEAYMTV